MISKSRAGMYLEAIILNHNRKERSCKECKEPILPGTANLMLMRRGRKGGKYYIYIHPPCILPMLWKERERRRVRDPKTAGRHPGSTLAALGPEERKERHKLIRARARLLRILVLEDDPEKIHAIVTQTQAMERGIKEILPFQVKKPGHRSSEDRATIDRKKQIAEAVERAVERERKRERRGQEA